jgi:hypothetical protein
MLRVDWNPRFQCLSGRRKTFNVLYHCDRQILVICCLQFMCLCLLWGVFRSAVFHQRWDQIMCVYCSAKQNCLLLGHLHLLNDATRMREWIALHNLNVTTRRRNVVTLRPIRSTTRSKPPSWYPLCRRLEEFKSLSGRWDEIKICSPCQSSVQKLFTLGVLVKLLTIMICILTASVV